MGELSGVKFLVNFSLVVCEAGSGFTKNTNMYDYELSRNLRH